MVECLPSICIARLLFHSLVLKNKTKYRIDTVVLIERHTLSRLLHYLLSHLCAACRYSLNHYHKTQNCSIDTKESSCASQDTFRKLYSSVILHQETFTF